MSATTTNTNTNNYQYAELTNGPYLDEWRQRVNKYQRKSQDPNDFSEYRHKKAVRVFFKRRRDYINKVDWKRTDVNAFDVPYHFVKKDQEKDRKMVNKMIRSLKNYKKDLIHFNDSLDSYYEHKKVFKAVIKQYHRKKVQLHATVILNHPHFKEVLSDQEKRTVMRDFHITEEDAGFIPLL